MKTALFPIMFSAIFSCAVLATPPSDALLEAIIQVESKGNPNAVGDDGKAIGLFQIHQCYWADAVEHDSSIGGSYQDCYDPAYARKIVIAYLDRYAKTATNEEMARIHNGGPRGHKKSATLKYWLKIKQKLS